MFTMNFRKIYLVALVVLTSLILLTGCKNEVVPEVEPTLIQIQSQGTAAPMELIAPNEDLALLWQVIDNLESYPSANHEMYHDITVNIIMNTGTNEHYVIDVDLMNQQLLISNGLTVKAATGDLIATLLKTSTFSTLIPDELSLPEVILAYEDRILSPQTVYDLKYTTYYDTVKSQSLTTVLPTTITDYTFTQNPNIKLTFTRTPETLTQIVTNLDTLEYIETPVEINELTLPSDNGNYEIILKAYFPETESYPYSGTVDYMLNVMINYPPSTYFVTSKTSTMMVEPGDMTFIAIDHVSLNDEIVIESPFASKVDTFMLSNAHYAVIATPSNADFDTYPVTVSIYKDTLLIHEEILSLTLSEKEFEVAHLYVTASTAAVRTDDNAAKDQPFFDRAWASNIQEPLWEGAFIQPAEGRISTEYGSIRVTNDNWNNTRRHNAIDIAAPIGTPILASNSGKIVCADPLYISGKTVIIDHGMGFYSIYFHLDEIYLELDSYVSKGDVIGTMGTTGYSTGSHLHFAIRHNGIYLNPWAFFQEGYMVDFPKLEQ